jgi:hypothetical protein
MTVQAGQQLDWHTANQRYLGARLGELLEHLTGSPDDRATSDAIRQEMQEPPALANVATIFDLSEFEQAILLMCAGVELDADFANKLGELGGEQGRAEPSFSLALARLPGAHWSALAPAAPLRHWRLVEPHAGGSLTTPAVRIDERILHYLTGVQYLDERLAASVEPFRDRDTPVATHRHLARGIADTVRRIADRAQLPAIELLGPDAGGKRAVAAEVARLLGVELFVLPAGEIPAGGEALHALALIWRREVALAGRALFIDAEDDRDVTANDRQSALARLIDSIPGLVFVACRARRNVRYRELLWFEVAHPPPTEQRALWVELLGAIDKAQSTGLSADNVETELQRVAAQFRLGLDGLLAARAEVASLLAADGTATSHQNLGRYVWDACRHQARPGLDDLAQRIEAAATWEDIVVPAEVTDALRQVAIHVRQRYTVLENWQLGTPGTRGLGTSALFAGASGTGKTMAAEVLANELRLDLYRIDVASVVSKYIGETEKNLRRVFDAAEEGGAILLFDEADALFGKRSEVKDSHDRYANIEVAYLLQRMEAYRGLAILTTNMKSALDPAFLRRLRFVVEIPFPDARARQRIWEGVFPPTVPTTALNAGKLAHLNVSGGHIRNIAIGAAFNAAEEGSAVDMRHLLDAARREYRKLDKPLQARETRGWNGVTCE